MAVPLQANALINLATLKGELGISLSDLSRDDVLNRRINAVSDAIEQYCNRKRYGFCATAVQQGVSINGRRGPRIHLLRKPVLSLVRIEMDAVPGPSSVLDPKQYALEDPVKGWVYNDARWDPTAMRALGIVQDWQSGTEKRLILVSYVGGYIAQPQIDAAFASLGGSAPWPGASKSVALGTFCNPASQAAQLWLCTNLASTITTGITGTTGLSDPFASQTSPAIGATVSDGTLTWTYLGTSSTAKTIPGNLEYAAIQAAVTFFRRQGTNTEIKSESVLGATETYEERKALPPEVRDILDSGFAGGVAFA